MAPGSSVSFVTVAALTPLTQLLGIVARDLPQDVVKPFAALLIGGELLAGGVNAQARRRPIS